MHRRSNAAGLSPRAARAGIVKHRRTGVGAALALVAVVGAGVGHPIAQDTAGSSPHAFDHAYRTYADLLRSHVSGTRVDYSRLMNARPKLAAIVDDLGRVTAQELSVWTRDEQLAYWINAYNVFTLQAIVDHYPIKNRWFTLFGLVPPNSIKQIPGVWNRLRWQAAGVDVTLDDIEHDTIRAHYDEPRAHFAVNCAAVSCPPLRPDPYVGVRLDGQLARAARDYLNSQHGLQVNGTTLRVSRIFSWYGEDFVPGYADRTDADRAGTERAILGVVSIYGPPRAARLAREEPVDIEFLRYDWSLNVIAPTP